MLRFILSVTAVLLALVGCMPSTFSLVHVDLKKTGVQVFTTPEDLRNIPYRYEEIMLVEVTPEACRQSPRLVTCSRADYPDYESFRQCQERQQGQRACGTQNAIDELLKFAEGQGADGVILSLIRADRLFGTLIKYNKEDTPAQQPSPPQRTRLPQPSYPGQE